MSVVSRWPKRLRERLDRLELGRPGLLQRRMPEVDQRVVVAPEQLGEASRARQLAGPKGEHDRNAAPSNDDAPSSTSPSCPWTSSQRSETAPGSITPCSARWSSDTRLDLIRSDDWAGSCLSRPEPIRCFPPLHRFRVKLASPGPEDAAAATTVTRSSTSFSASDARSTLPVLGIRLDRDAALEPVQDERRHDRRPDVRPDVDDRPTLHLDAVLRERPQPPVQGRRTPFAAGSRRALRRRARAARTFPRCARRPHTE